MTKKEQKTKINDCDFPKKKTNLPGVQEIIFLETRALSRGSSPLALNALARKHTNFSRRRRTISA